MKRGWARAGLLWVVTALGAFAAFPTGVRAQLLDELRAAYRAARDDVEARVSARSVVENEWQAVLDSIDAANERGDDGARDEAYLIAQTRAISRDEQIRLEEEARERLDVARANLRAALLREISELETAYDTASAVRAEELDAIIEGYEREIRQLELERELPRVATVARITIESIDRPEDICVKASVLALRADQLEETLAELSTRINELERRLRQQQRRADARTLRERFDDVRVPVGGSAQSGTGGGSSSIAATDSLGIRQPQTLEEEIQLLETVRAETEGYRNELRGLVRNWIVRAGGCG